MEIGNELQCVWIYCHLLNGHVGCILHALYFLFEKRLCAVFDFPQQIVVLQGAGLEEDKPLLMEVIIHITIEAPLAILLQAYVAPK